jgi:hypothetical protein
MAAIKGINWDEQPLGKVPDNKLAKLLGVDSSGVSAARRRRGIKPFCVKRIDWDKQPLGEKKDKEIANSLNVSVQAVHQARQKRGIMSYSEKMAMWHDFFKESKELTG